MYLTFDIRPRLRDFEVMAQSLLNLPNLLIIHLMMFPSLIHAHLITKETTSKRDSNDAPTAAIVVIAVFGALIFLFLTAAIGTCVYAWVHNMRFDMRGICLRPRPPPGIPRTRATI
jgi:hypothetical protein